LIDQNHLVFIGNGYIMMREFEIGICCLSWHWVRTVKDTQL